MIKAKWTDRLRNKEAIAKIEEERKLMVVIKKRVKVWSDMAYTLSAAEMEGKIKWGRAKSRVLG